MFIPTDLSDISGMIAAATSVMKKLQKINNLSEPKK
jgi:hypothetical protein